MFVNVVLISNLFILITFPLLSTVNKFRIRKNPLSALALAHDAAQHSDRNINVVRILAIKNTCACYLNVIGELFILT
jgi:hypothetical protein